MDITGFWLLESLTKHPLIIGIDEAGRGALAGPVIAAAVAFTTECSPSDFKDSKQLSQTQREERFEKLKKITPFIGIGIVSETQIDRINILKATLKAMELALFNLPSECLTNCKILIDGNKAPHLPKYTVETIVKGDQLIPEISAASIVAKVTRDTLMQDYDITYPNHLFKEHKGYGTQQHYQRLFEYGITPIHRKSFNLTLQKTLFS